tara:strand:- start:1215 stop:1436 length:222 start_codon:yes stop_codon:yes gene_type:complete
MFYFIKFLTILSDENFGKIVWPSLGLYSVPPTVPPIADIGIMLVKTDDEVAPTSKLYGILPALCDPLYLFLIP